MLSPALLLQLFLISLIFFLLIFIINILIEVSSSEENASRKYSQSILVRPRNQRVVAIPRKQKRQRKKRTISFPNGSGWFLSDELHGPGSVAQVCFCPTPRSPSECLLSMAASSHAQEIVSLIRFDYHYPCLGNRK